MGHVSRTHRVDLDWLFAGKNRLQTFSPTVLSALLSGMTWCNLFISPPHQVIKLLSATILSLAQKVHRHDDRICLPKRLLFAQREAKNVCRDTTDKVVGRDHSKPDAGPREDRLQQHASSRGPVFRDRSERFEVMIRAGNR